MHTTGANQRPALCRTGDFRFLEMFDGALPPPEEPPPNATHDFLVLNPHSDLAPDTGVVTRIQPGPDG